MEEADILEQLVVSMADAAEKLEEAAKNKNLEYFNKIRVFMIDIHKRMTEELERTNV